MEAPAAAEAVVERSARRPAARCFKCKNTSFLDPDSVKACEVSFDTLKRSGKAGTKQTRRATSGVCSVCGTKAWTLGDGRSDSAWNKALASEAKRKASPEAEAKRKASPEAAAASAPDPKKKRVVKKAPTNEPAPDVPMGPAVLQ